MTFRSFRHPGRFRSSTRSWTAFSIHPALATSPACGFVAIEAFDAGLDAGVAIVQRDRCDEQLGLLIGQRYTLPFLRIAVDDDAEGEDQRFREVFGLIVHAGSNAPLNSGSA